MNCKHIDIILSVALFVTVSFAQRVIEDEKQKDSGSKKEQAADSIQAGFRKPPDSAKPRTWWHWTRSNVTKEGITKDLEWMRRVGIAGFQLADVNFGGGQTVDEKIIFGSPEWLSDVRYSASEANRLNLEMAIFSSAGWSLTGGPWVRPEQAMKKLVWSKTSVEGPGPLAVKLSLPPTCNGPIRNLAGGGGRSAALTPDPTYYDDSAVIAYRTPPDEIDMASRNYRATSSAGAINPSPLIDDDLNTMLTIPGTSDGTPAWIQFEFDQPFKVRAVSLAGPGGIPVGRVTASNDGETFRTLVTLPGTQLYRQGRVRTFAVAATEASFYRIEFVGAPLNPAATISQTPPKPADEYILTEARLHSGARVHRWEDKAGFSFLFNYEGLATPNAATEAAIQPSEVVDLTSNMTADGILRWQVPAGKWTILRMGYSLTGAKNRPAVPAGLGYEVDKLNREHLLDYLRNYTDPIATSLGPLYGKSLRAVLLDSWEAGMQNWTDDMLIQFSRRRGYDPLPYLPVLTGRLVGSAELSDRFLWDFRRTLADMFAENHYRIVTEFFNERGIQTYGEASGVSLEILEDALLCKKYVDIPMGEFWVNALHPELMYYQDVRGAASAAHAYGKKVVAAEAFTGGHYEAPYKLKTIADYWFAQGVNRIVFHTSAHQPLDTKPGNTMVGTHLHRNITWAEQAEPFMTYLARNSFMLQQGKFVADLAYLLDEGAPSTMPIWGAGLKPQPPYGYDYDYINADVLLNRLSVDEHGRLILPDGMIYRVLVLPPSRRMTLPVLRKLRELVTNGATVLGPKPLVSPSLVEYPNVDGEVTMLANEIWGDLDGVSRTKRFCGKGMVVWGLPLLDVLTSLQIEKDVEYTRLLDGNLSWIHRRRGETDIYFVANQNDRRQEIEIRFRVADKEPELWYPDSGEIEPAAYVISGGKTLVSLQLAQGEAVFVVFRHSAAALSRSLPGTICKTLAVLDGPWDIRFPPDLGAPSQIQLAKLEPWTAHQISGVKYFSGTGTYSISIYADQSWLGSSSQTLLNLGDVRDLAEVSLNGQSLGILWKPPYVIDVSNHLNPGENRLEIKVTNQWTNRLLGDSNSTADVKVLEAAPVRWFRGPPKLPVSGLIGPVSLVSCTNL